MDLEILLLDQETVNHKYLIEEAPSDCHCTKISYGYIDEMILYKTFFYEKIKFELDYYEFQEYYNTSIILIFGIF